MIIIRCGDACIHTELADVFSICPEKDINTDTGDTVIRFRDGESFTFPGKASDWIAALVDACERTMKHEYLCERKMLPGESVGGVT